MSSQPGSESQGKILSEEQQEALNRRKVDLRKENELYLRAHPELKVLMGAFVSAALRAEPTDTVKFAAEYFRRDDLRDTVTEALSERR